MLEQRNAFITEMNTSFISQKKKLNNILSILQWTPQSVAGTIKEADDVGTSEFLSEVAENDPEIKDSAKESEGSKDLDNIQILVKDEGCSFSLYGIQKWITLCLGTSKDSEKRYNELLASLSFQPKVKQEKLSDTQLLASLLETERNAKRRRISYRNKVHTKNKSHTEVLREVISEQMETLRDNEEETDSNKASRTSGKLEEEDEMFEVRVMDGNPHLAWQTVGLVVGEQRRERKKSCGFLSNDKISTGHRQERRNPDYVHEKNGSDNRKYNHYDRQDKKRRSTPYRDNSANNRHSRHSRSDRSSRDWDRSSKSSHKSSRSHHSKHRRHDR